MTRLVRLEALGPWHLGARGVGMEETASSVGADTIFSALCHAFLHLYGDVEALLQPFLDGTPPFRISSAFPYGPEGWYPVRPQGAGLNWRDPKAMKSVRYVHQDAWLRWCAGEVLADSEWEVNGAFLCREGGLAPISREAVPHVALDRTSHASNLYFTGELFFGEGCGMALLLHADEAEWTERVLALLEWLGEAGIGGERTSGHGQFTVSDEEAPFTYCPGERLVLLSGYVPRHKAELAGWDLSQSAYAFEARRGYMDAPASGGLRRKSVRMVAEGSVLVRRGGEPEAVGSLADVTPDVHTAHRVYRYGLPFTAVWND